MPSLVKTLLTAPYEEEKKVEAHSKLEEALPVTGKGGTNTKSVSTSIEHMTDAHCEPDESVTDEDTHSDEPKDETDERATIVTKNTGPDIVKVASNVLCETPTEKVDSEENMADDAPRAPRVEPEEQSPSFGLQPTTKK